MFKGKLHLKPKFGLFCALSQNYCHFLEKLIGPSVFKKIEILKNGFKISEGQVVLEQLIKTIFARLINNLQTTWPSEILTPFCSSSGNLIALGCLGYNYFFFQTSDDNFKISHKTCSILV